MNVKSKQYIWKKQKVYLEKAVYLILYVTVSRIVLQHKSD